MDGDEDDEMWELAMRPEPCASQSLDWLAPNSEEEDLAGEEEKQTTAEGEAASAWADS